MIFSGQKFGYPLSLSINRFSQNVFARQSSLEISYVLQGSYEVITEQFSKTIHTHEMVIIAPYDMHMLSLTRKKILVIGGGVAGMEAAFVARKRGHEVVLCDKQDSLGGLVKIAAVPIAKQDLIRVIQYMEHKLHTSGVEIRLGCETADYLAPLVNDLFPKNREIILLEMAEGIMQQESGSGRSLLTQRMMKKGVQIHCKAKVERVEADRIYYTQNEQTYYIDDADTLVLAMGYRPNLAVEEMLKDSGVTYHMIGDAKQIGNIKDAISQGYQVAREI